MDIYNFLNLLFLILQKRSFIKKKLYLNSLKPKNSATTFDLQILIKLSLSNNIFFLQNQNFKTT